MAGFVPSVITRKLSLSQNSSCFVTMQSFLLHFLKEVNISLYMSSFEKHKMKTHSKTTYCLNHYSKENYMSIISRYNRVSYVFDTMEIPMEHMWFSKWRKNILSGLSGRVLDLGIGTGKNISYYPDECEVVGVDISNKMLSHAKRKAREGKRKNISLFQMDAENLGFKDDSFDYVITTFVLCSIPDPVAALKEMKRLCRPDGMVINLEHMKSDNKSIAFVENIFNPLTVAATGVNINRETVENIRKSGLNIVEVRNMAFLDVFRLIKSRP
ncbi:MAG: methyltransferase domain-containing protein [Methanolobus sp.]